MKFKFLLVCLAIFYSAGALGCTYEYRLDNGLKLIVREDHRAPAIVSQVWYKVGSSYESTGLTGISHALEHMMFKGTTDYSGEHFTRLITEKGGQENAFTSYDYTAYYQVISSSELPLVFKYESDRMQNLDLKESDFVPEKNVIKEERFWRVDDNPNAVARERFYHAAFPASTYSQPVIGWLYDIESLTVQDLENWYNKWYRPNNATIVIVGDVKPESVFNLAKQYFGHIKSKPLPFSSSPRGTLPILANRRLEVIQPAKLPHLFVGYNVPSYHTAVDPYHPATLEIIASLLDGGDSSRFSKNLIREKEVATFSSATYHPFNKHGTIFEIRAVPTEKTQLKQLEDAVIEQLELLKNVPVSKSELEKIKIQLVAQKTYEKDSMFYQAYEIGALESSNYSWKQANEYLNELQNVTPQQIMATAKAFFVGDRQTVTYLIPKEIDSNIKPEAAKDERPA